jgi:hypothetical protein
MKPPSPPANQRLKRAHELLEYGIQSTNSLAELYDRLTKKRGPGAPTHEDQDLLRAMLVMAGATLDIVVKTIVRDTLHVVVAKNRGARSKACDYVHRRLLKTIEDRGGQRLAEALLSESPQAAIVDFIIDDITGGSMQSVDQLQQAAAYLGLENFQVAPEVRDALTARNQIVHEMDAIEEEPGGKGSRRRRQRKKLEMRDWAKALLQVAANLCGALDKALANPGG